MIVWEMDAQTRRFTRVSGGAEAVLGYPLERWHGVPGFWIGILHPDDRERVARAIWRALHEHRPCQIEYRAIASDGTVVRLRDRVRVIRDSTGALLLQGSIVDLTERTVALPTRRRRGRRRFRHELRAGLPGVAHVPYASFTGRPTPIDAAGSEPVADTLDIELSGRPASGGEPAGGEREGLPSPGLPHALPLSSEPPPFDAESPPLISTESEEAERETGVAGTEPGWRFPFEGVDSDAGIVSLESGLEAVLLPDLELADEPGAVPPEARPEGGSSTPAEGLRILHALSEAVIASDAEHRVVYWSPAAETMLGWTSEEAMGREDAELLRTHATAGQTTAIIEGLLGHRPWSAEVVVQKRDGENIPVRIGAAALRGDGGQVAGYVAVVTDLRETRAAERRRSAASTMDAVARLARGVGDELAGGVERIETALRSVLVGVPRSDSSRASLDEALRGVDSAAALAAELKSAGRPEPVQPGLVDLHDLVERSLPAMRLLVPPGVEMTVGVEPAVRPAAADPAAVSQVLMNLVASSSHALPADGLVRIRISTETFTSRDAELVSPRLEAGEWVVLEVSRDRSPIPLDLDRMFEPFLDASVQGPPGLGLAVAHGLIAGCGGVLVARPVAEGIAFRAYFRPASVRAG
jgi:PAS domain S-box-containing protein